MEETIMDDSKIIELFFSRSEDAIIHCKTKYEKYCHSIAYNILHNQEDSDECLNDTWLSAWDTIPPAKPLVLSTYLGKITRNHALDRYRNYTAKKRNGNQTTIVLEELSECISSGQNIEDEIINKNEIIQIFDSFLDELSSNARIIFLQRYWYMMSVKDIAHNNNLSQSAVKMSLLRSRECLKQRLVKEEYEP